jgi:hypothetical protein
MDNTQGATCVSLKMIAKARQNLQASAGRCDKVQHASSGHTIASDQLRWPNPHTEVAHPHTLAPRTPLLLACTAATRRQGFCPCTLPIVQASAAAPQKLHDTRPHHSTCCEFLCARSHRQMCVLHQQVWWGQVNCCKTLCAQCNTIGTATQIGALSPWTGLLKHTAGTTRVANDSINPAAYAAVGYIVNTLLTTVGI